MGHVFVIHGDIRKLFCDAWLLPCSEQAWPDSHWLEWPPGLTEFLVRPRPPADWHPEGRRVLKLPGWPPGYPQPFLTNVGLDRQRPLGWFIEGAVQFVRAAVSELRGGLVRLTARARPLLAVPVVGTGYGGAKDVAGDVVRLLLPALQDLAARHQVDLALVTYEEQTFAAAQHYRRTGTDAWPELDDALRRTADRLAALASGGELVLFLGSGVSAGAGLPMWGELLDRLARKVGMNDEERAALRRLDYMDQGHILERRCDAPELPRQMIAQAMQRYHHALAHALLASLPVQQVVTTNYDQLFELAYHSTGQKALAVLPHAPRQGATAWLLKLHGCVERPQDIVLTRRDYMRFDEQHSALAGIVQAQLFTKQMLFIGFSLSDANFLRIADAVRRALRTVEPRPGAPRTFGVALALTRNPLLAELWGHDLEWVAMEQPGEGAPRPAPQEAARRLDIFLDYLLAQASDVTAHLLDHRFDGLLSAPERMLQRALEDFLAAVPTPARRAPAWAQIAALLGKLGLHRESPDDS